MKYVVLSVVGGLCKENYLYATFFSVPFFLVTSIQFTYRLKRKSIRDVFAISKFTEA